MLQAYLDASDRVEGLFSVAAYIFESGQSRRFRQNWRNTFPREKFSWADLIARSDPFRGITPDQRDELVKSGVGLVREHPIAGVVVSCWSQDVERFSPRFVKGFAHAYSICCHLCATGIGMWARNNGVKGGIAYILEAGDGFSADAEHLFSYAAHSPEVANSYQWKSHGFAPKDVGAPFHAPDLLAWEWGKYWTETVAQEKRKMRLSLGHLLIGQLDRYRFQHLGGDPLLMFFNQIRELGLQQMQEDRAAASAVASSDLTADVEASQTTTHDEAPS